MLTSGAVPTTGEGKTRNITEAADNGFNAAFELVMTPTLFGFLGYLLDNWLNTGRFLTFALAGLVALYEVWKLWYNYNLRIDRLHAEIMRPKTGATPAVALTPTDDPA